jgi:hypothetical protein
MAERVGAAFLGKKGDGSMQKEENDEHGKGRGTCISVTC